MADPLERDLEHPDPERRRKAIFSIFAQKRHDLLERLQMMACREKDEALSVLAAQVFIALKGLPSDPKLEEEIDGLLRKPDPIFRFTSQIWHYVGAAATGEVIKRVIQALPAKPPETAIRFLDRCLGHPDPEIREMACKPATRAMDPTLFTHVFVLTCDPDEGVSVAAFRAINQLARSEFSGLLERALRSPDPWVQENIGAFLPTIAEDDLREILLKAKESSYPVVSMKAREAVLRMDRMRAVRERLAEEARIRKEAEDKKKAEEEKRQQEEGRAKEKVKSPPPPNKPAKPFPINPTIPVAKGQVHVIPSGTAASQGVPAAVQPVGAQSAGLHPAGSQPAGSQPAGASAGSPQVAQKAKGERVISLKGKMAKSPVSESQEGGQPASNAEGSPPAHEVSPPPVPEAAPQAPGPLEPGSALVSPVQPAVSPPSPVASPPVPAAPANPLPQAVAGQTASPAPDAPHSPPAQSGAAAAPVAASPVPGKAAQAAASAVPPSAPVSAPPATGAVPPSPQPVPILPGARPPMMPKAEAPTPKVAPAAPPPSPQAPAPSPPAASEPPPPAAAVPTAPTPAPVSKAEGGPPIQIGKTQFVDSILSRYPMFLTAPFSRLYEPAPAEAHLSGLKSLFEALLAFLNLSFLQSYLFFSTRNPKIDQVVKDCLNAHLGGPNAVRFLHNISLGLKGQEKNTAFFTFPLAHAFSGGSDPNPLVVLKELAQFLAEPPEPLSESVVQAVEAVPQLLVSVKGIIQNKLVIKTKGEFLDLSGPQPKPLAAGDRPSLDLPDHEVILLSRDRSEALGLFPYFPFDGKTVQFTKPSKEQFATLLERLELK